MKTISAWTKAVVYSLAGTAAAAIIKERSLLSNVQNNTAVGEEQAYTWTGEKYLRNGMSLTAKYLFNQEGCEKIGTPSRI